MTRDYAAWDDTYTFVVDRNQEYVEKNLVDSTFINLGLNLILIVNPSGEIVFQKGFDLQQKREIPISSSILNHISADSPLVHHSNEESMVEGIIVLAEGWLLVASSPILTSKYSGPIRGAFVMGRYLDSEEITSLGQTAHLSISINRIDDLKLPSDFQMAWQELLEGRNEIVVIPLDEDSVAGYALIDDVYGKPSLVLRVDLPREIYKEAQKNATYFIYSLIVTASTFSVAIALLIERLVVSRVTRLDDMVKRIGKRGDMSARVPATGNDEISSLGNSINNMLALLEEHRRELSTERDKLELVTKNVGAGLAVVSRDFKIEWANEIWKEVFGDIEGRSCDGSCIQQRSNCGVREIFEKGLERVVHEQVRRDKDGNTSWLEVISTPIRDRDGNVTGALELTVPITERKQMENELRKHLEHLEALVEERTRKLVDYERLAAIGQTAMMVGHDLRNPLQVMMNTVYLAGEHLKMILPYVKDPKRAEEIQGLCSSMEEQIDYMNKIVSDLQDFARPLKPQLSETDMSQLIGDIVSTIRRPENIEVLIDIQNEFRKLRVDAAMLRRALTNLITNAIQSMPKGGRVTIKITRKGDNALISIEDTGVGIPEENLKRLFQPLFTTKAKGQGLGLPVTKRIVEAHGGKINVKSKVGAGTTFTIELPIEGR
jgi:hypothetical protein